MSAANFKVVLMGLALLALIGLISASPYEKLDSSSDGDDGDDDDDAKPKNELVSVLCETTKSHESKARHYKDDKVHKHHNGGEGTSKAKSNREDRYEMPLPEDRVPIVACCYCCDDAHKVYFGVEISGGKCFCKLDNSIHAPDKKTGWGLLRWLRKLIFG